MAKVYEAQGIVSPRKRGSREEEFCGLTTYCLRRGVKDLDCVWEEVGCAGWVVGGSIHARILAEVVVGVGRYHVPVKQEREIAKDIFLHINDMPRAILFSSPASPPLLVS